MEQFFIRLKKQKQGLQKRLVTGDSLPRDSMRGRSLPKVKLPSRSRSPLSIGTFEEENEGRAGSRERREIKQLFRDSKEKKRWREGVSRDKIHSIKEKSIFASIEKLRAEQKLKESDLTFTPQSEKLRIFSPIKKRRRNQSVGRRRKSGFEEKQKKYLLKEKEDYGKTYFLI